MIPPAELTQMQRDILKKYPTYKEFLNNFNPAQLLVNYDEINTIEQSVSKRRMRIADIDVIYVDVQRNAAVDYLVKWLDFLNRFSNINKQLTELNSVAYMIYKDYKDMYLSDLKIIFEKIMRAEYGPFYGSVDSQRILYGFMQYGIERKILMQKRRVSLEIELENHIDKVKKDVGTQVFELMKKHGFDQLQGEEYFAKRQELTSELMPKAIAEAREKFLTEYENKITNGKN